MCAVFVFQPDLMYYWTHSEPILQQLELIPGKLSPEVWPPVRPLGQEGESLLLSASTGEEGEELGGLERLITFITEWCYKERPLPSYLNHRSHKWFIFINVVKKPLYLQVLQWVSLGWTITLSLWD